MPKCATKRRMQQKQRKPITVQLLISSGLAAASRRLVRVD